MDFSKHFIEMAHNFQKKLEKKDVDAKKLDQMQILQISSISESWQILYVGMMATCPFFFFFVEDRNVLTWLACVEISQIPSLMRNTLFTLNLHSYRLEIIQKV